MAGDNEAMWNAALYSLLGAGGGGLLGTLGSSLQASPDETPEERAERRKRWALAGMLLGGGGTALYNFLPQAIEQAKTTEKPPAIEDPTGEIQQTSEAVPRDKGISLGLGAVGSAAGIGATEAGRRTLRGVANMPGAAREQWQTATAADDLRRNPQKAVSLLKEILVSDAAMKNPTIAGSKARPDLADLLHPDKLKVHLPLGQRLLPSDLSLLQKAHAALPLYQRQVHGLGITPDKVVPTPRLGTAFAKGWMKPRGSAGAALNLLGFLGGGALGSNLFGFNERSLQGQTALTDAKTQALTNAR